MTRVRGCLTKVVDQFCAGLFGGLGVGLGVLFVVWIVVAAESGVLGSEFRVGFQAFFGVR